MTTKIRLTVYRSGTIALTGGENSDDPLTKFSVRIWQDSRKRCGADDDVESEEAARVEDIARSGGGGGGGAGGEGEAGESEEVGGGEDGEGEVEGRDEASGREDHDEGDKLELDDPEGAHDTAHNRLLRW